MKYFHRIVSQPKCQLQSTIFSPFLQKKLWHYVQLCKKIADKFSPSVAEVAKNKRKQIIKLILKLFKLVEKNLFDFISSFMSW